MQANKSAIFSKVPEITLFFWIIKVLCTTVGETVADFLATNLNLGLTGTTIVMGIVLLGILFLQFKSKRYVPAIYWLVVVLLSVFGTLITDNLVDNFGMSLVTATVLFSIALAIVFVAWYASEKTLSIHSIYTTKRETWYWLTILFTFALGTAAGDLIAERLGLGYLVTGLVIFATIAAVAIAWRFGLDEILGFWLVYIMTRPLGASVGDYLSQAPANGGLGLGPTVTSGIFLAAILAVVIFLSVTRRDAIAAPEIAPEIKTNRPSALLQLVGVVVVLVIASGVGYSWRSTQLAAVRAANVAAPSPLGDLSAFRTIAEDALKMVNSGDLAGAKTRVADIESAWDSATTTLKALNPDKWTLLDTDIDHVLTSLRASQPDAKACSTALQSMIDLVNTLDPSTNPNAASSVKPNAAPQQAELTSTPLMQSPTVPAAKSVPLTTTASLSKTLIQLPPSPLGDLSTFRTIAEDALKMANSGDLTGAKTRVADIESAWDSATTTLKTMNPDKWTLLDTAIDHVLTSLRASQPDAKACSTALQSMIDLVNTLDPHK